MKSIRRTSPETHDHICRCAARRFAAPEILEALKVNKHAAICQKLGHIFVFPNSNILLVDMWFLYRFSFKGFPTLHQLQQGGSVFSFNFILVQPIAYGF